MNLMSSPGTNDEILLRCTSGPVYAVVGVVGGLFMMLVFVAQLATQSSAKSSATDISILLMVGAGIFMVGLVSLLRPMVLFEATPSGIMLYAETKETDRMTISQSITEDLFVPWDRIESIRFLNHEQAHAAGLWLMAGTPSTYTHPFVVLKIRRDLNWPPMFSMRLGQKNTRPDEIYLDAYVGSLRHIRMYVKLEELRATYSSPRTFANH